ncbi:MAG TPA: 2-oxoacid:acceptor oxidoreductase subunit alpha [Alphaproteobacteria bacterium]|nr:2-oxoacid:acceptor oxidoreductase subunit alpha [Alphaproteobacteria bacterium]
MSPASTKETSERQSIALAINGSGGAGAITAGGMLLKAAARAGFYGLFTRSVGPQIRGGEAAAILRLATVPVDAAADRCDLQIAIDWMNADRFAGELNLGPDSLVVADSNADEAPQVIAASGARIVALPIAALAKAIKGGRPNMVALGIAAAAIGLPREALDAEIETTLADKGTGAITASKEALAAGIDAASEIEFTANLAPTAPAAEARWIISGNEAAGLGAIRGGVRFVAAYPITPATEILEWMAPALVKAGGSLVQAEDELASINMIIGASYGGVPALTATSGPGLALMLESLGLAVASEVPVVVVDVMRGGPSTGIPTKSEQSDLNMALHGCHGDAPHIVVAPTSVADCLFTTQWAVHLAEAMQAPAIVLSDQFLGQAKAVIDRPADLAFIANRKVEAAPAVGYRRYALTADGVSPMTVPGTAGGQYTADGLEHNPRGTPSTAASDHSSQLDKRSDKLTGFDYGQHWADVEGAGPLAVITWGSSTGPAREAIGMAREDGLAVKLIALRLLAPSRPEDFAAALEGVERMLVVEQTHSGQFLRHLRAEYGLPRDAAHLCRPGPLNFRAQEILSAIRELQ